MFFKSQRQLHAFLLLLALYLWAQFFIQISDQPNFTLTGHAEERYKVCNVGPTAWQQQGIVINIQKKGFPLEKKGDIIM